MSDTQDEAPAVVARQPLPKSATMTARQLLNWRAFGRSTDADLSLLPLICERWLYPPEDHKTHPTLIALKMLVAGQTEWPEGDGRTISERTVSRHLLEVRSLVARRGLPASKLAEELLQELLVWQVRQQILAQAQQELRDALVSGVLAARATPVMKIGEPPSIATRLSAEVFGGIGTSMSYSGDIFARGTLIYTGTYFLTEEVRQAWQSLPHAAAPLPKLESSRAGIGGPTPKYDWKAFAREMIRIAALEADGSLTERAFREMMRAWAAENMVAKDGKAPDDRTVEKEFKALLPPGICAD